MDADNEQTQEVEPTEPVAPEAEPKEPQGEEPEAAPESPEAKPESEKPEDDEAEEQKAEAAEEKGRSRGGWKRKLERQERLIETLAAQLNSHRAAAPQQAQPDASKPSDPAAQVQEYIRAEARAVLEAERAREQQARAQADFQKRMQEVKAAHPDFEEALEDVSHIPVPAHVQQMLTGPQGPDLMYVLAKNPAELDRISRLAPLDAARELGRLEAKASSTPAPKTPIKSAPRPPVPPTNVSGKSSGARNLDDLPLADYKRAYRSGRR